MVAKPATRGWVTVTVSARAVVSASDGRLLLVNRGFIPGQGTDPPPPPSGTVEVANQHDGCRFRVLLPA